MKCSELGGPESCSVEFSGASFDEIAKLSHQHGMEMFQSQDAAHMQAGAEMKKLMEAGKMQEWMQEKREAFDALAEEK